MGLIATGLKKDHFFVGDISTEYKSGNTTVNLKFDTYSNVSTNVTISDVLPSMKAAFSFDIPDHKSGKMDIHYLHRRVAFNSSIGLNPTPLLELAAVIGDEGLALGGDVGFDTGSSSFTKYNAGITFNSVGYKKTNSGQGIGIVANTFSGKSGDWAGLSILGTCGSSDGQRTDVEGTYVQSVNPSSGTVVSAEMIHKFSTYENSFSIGSAHVVDPLTAENTILQRWEDCDAMSTTVEAQVPCNCFSRVRHKGCKCFPKIGRYPCSQSLR